MSEEKGKMTTIKGFKVKQDIHHTYIIRVNDLQLGDSVSTNHVECRVKGCLPHIKGKHDSSEIYIWGNTICGPCFTTCRSPLSKYVRHQ